VDAFLAAHDARMGTYLRADPASVPGAHAVDIPGWITYRAPSAHGKTAARSGDRSVTRAKLERDIGSAAAWLRSGGVWPGDRLPYPGPNCPELLELLVACARLGAIFVPVGALPLSGYREETR
jgi:acyl-CoA synthetase (AMP-forming)/AMP-acid ligase II